MTISSRIMAISVLPGTILVSVVLSYEFSSPPTTVKALENNTVLLPCYLNTLSNDGAHAIGISWYQNDVLLGSITNATTVTVPPRHVLWENGSLEIRQVRPEDNGRYTCEISRPAPWGVVRQMHAIEVLHPPSVDPYPDNRLIVVRLGEEVRMSCNGNGMPYPIITWSHEGQEMQLLDHRELLVFTASDRHLAGSYECVAANGVGKPARARIELHIIYPPEVMAPKTWIHTAPGYMANLECRVSAVPQANVVWLKGEVEVPLDRRVDYYVDDEKHVLHIRNVQRSDFGIYTCKAINKLGERDVQIQLSGVPNPGVFKRKPDTLNKKDSSYTLIWEVDSYTPIIEYSLWFRPYKTGRGLNKPDWTKLTIPAEYNSGPVYSKNYTLRGLKGKTIYEVLLVSRNRYGWSKPSAILRFATEGAEVEDDTVSTVQLSAEDSVAVSLDLKTSSSSSSTRRFVPVVFLLIKYLFLVNVR